ncbi:MAG: class I SAM-dependent methyltransferase [Spirochaetales bacterium]|nr:class I SAM-dependent methyltransferase [Spirochaetales bacterium]
MYRNAGEVPWHQDETARWLLSDITLAIVRNFRPGRFLELGCGLGYFTARVNAEKSTGIGFVAGVDISATAIDKARAMHAGITFARANILDSGEIGALLKNLGGPFNMVLSKELMWYILDDLPQFMSNLAMLIAPGGMLYVSQTFPDSTPFYGIDRFPNARVMSDYFESYFSRQYECIERDAQLGNREMLHFVGKKL